MTFFRIQTADRDPADLLNPENQISYHWNDNDNDARTGVSVCDSRENLAHYLAHSGIPFGVGQWVIVELDGHESDDTPYDTASGERLIHPTAILAVGPMDDDFYALIDSVYDAMEA